MNEREGRISERVVVGVRERRKGKRKN